MTVLLLFLEEYWSNSQYCLRLQAPEKSMFARRSDDDNTCQVVVSLMQKNSRRRRNVHRDCEVAMTFDLYKV